MPRNPSTSVVSAPLECRASNQVQPPELRDKGSVQLGGLGNAEVRGEQRLPESNYPWDRILSPGDFAIDFGAHTGDACLPIALATGPTGLVLAFEPNPYSYAVLAENVRLNQGNTCIDARNVAASDVDGPLVGRYLPPTGPNLRHRYQWPLFERRQAVPIEGRDIYYMLKTEFPAWLPKLKYVRMAAGGSTLSILQAIRPILSERRPLISCEIATSLATSSRWGLYDFLDHLGYDIGHSMPQSQQVEPTISRTSIGKMKRLDLLAAPRPKRSPRRVAA
jgi:FkbM family methyltransferase